MKINAYKLQILAGKRNLTMKALAEKAGVSRQTVSCIASGKGCSVGTVCKLANALAVNEEEILEAKRGGRMDKKLYVELPKFTGRNVPISEIAAAIGKDPKYVRLGIQQGILKFGEAIKVGKSNAYSYYCSDKKVWEETGYFRSMGKEKALA